MMDKDETILRPFTTIAMVLFGDVGVSQLPAACADACGLHVAMASGETHTVTSPRWAKARSYEAQFATRYLVLYVGWTFDVIPSA